MTERDWMTECGLDDVHMTTSLLISFEMLIMSSMALVLDQFCSSTTACSRYIEAFTAMPRPNFIIAIIMKIYQFKLLVVAAMAIPLNDLGAIVYARASNIQTFTTVTSNNVVKSVTDAAKFEFLIVAIVTWPLN
jgi:hypothetical protein